MDEEGFREFIKEGKRVPKGLKEDTIRSHIRTVKEFERFLKGSGKSGGFDDAREGDVKAYVAELADKCAVERDDLLALLRYSRFRNNNDTTAALLVLLISETLQTVVSSFKVKMGKKVYDNVLGDFRAPALGTPPKLMPRSTCEFMDRLERGIGAEATRKFLLENCPDVGPPEHYAEERELFLASKDVDDYLKRRREKFVEELEGYMREGTLFFNQRIDQSVIDYVKRNPEVGVGDRRGKFIYHTKIPYMAIEYLREKDPKMRRYLYCHCPLARESILSGERISRNLCYCSGGYTKRPFEVAFDRPLTVEIRKSALWGDSVCQFAIEVPEDLLPRDR